MQFTIVRNAHFLILGVLVVTWLVAMHPDRAHAQELEESTLYIVFLNLESDSANDPTVTENERALSDRAQRLGIETIELSSLFEAARVYKAEENSLRDEAKRYHEAQIATGDGPDIAALRQFSVRRSVAAQGAFESLQSKMSPASYQRLRAYVLGELKSSITVWR